MDLATAAVGNVPVSKSATPVKHSVLHLSAKRARAAAAAADAAASAAPVGPLMSEGEGSAEHAEGVGYASAMAVARWLGPAGAAVEGACGRPVDGGHAATTANRGRVSKVGVLELRGHSLERCSGCCSHGGCRRIMSMCDECRLGHEGVDDGGAVLAALSQHGLELGCSASHGCSDECEVLCRVHAHGHDQAFIMLHGWIHEHCHEYAPAPTASQFHAHAHVHSHTHAYAHSRARAHARAHEHADAHAHAHARGGDAGNSMVGVASRWRGPSRSHCRWHASTPTHVSTLGPLLLLVFLTLVCQQQWCHQPAAHGPIGEQHALAQLRLRRELRQSRTQQQQQQHHKHQQSSKGHDRRHGANKKVHHQTDPHPHRHRHSHGHERRSEHGRSGHGHERRRRRRGGHGEHHHGTHGHAHAHGHGRVWQGFEAQGGRMQGSSVSRVEVPSQAAAETAATNPIVATSAASSAVVNLVSNPSFEQMVGNTPSAWTCEGVFAYPSTFSPSTAAAFDGRFALQLGGCDATTGACSFGYAYQAMRTVPGQRYNVYFYYLAMGPPGQVQGLKLEVDNVTLMYSAVAGAADVAAGQGAELAGGGRAGAASFELATASFVARMDMTYIQFVVVQSSPNSTVIDYVTVVAAPSPSATQQVLSLTPGCNGNASSVALPSCTSTFISSTANSPLLLSGGATLSFPYWKSNPNSPFALAGVVNIGAQSGFPSASAAFLPQPLSLVEAPTAVPSSVSPASSSSSPSSSPSTCLSRSFRTTFRFRAGIGPTAAPTAATAACFPYAVSTTSASASVCSPVSSGFALVLTPDPVMGGPGHRLGYGRTCMSNADLTQGPSGRNSLCRPSVAVEFDVWRDGSGGDDATAADVNNNHVGLNLDFNMNSVAAQDARAPWGSLVAPQQQSAGDGTLPASSAPGSPGNVAPAAARSAVDSPFAPSNSSGSAAGLNISDGQWHAVAVVYNASRSSIQVQLLDKDSVAAPATPAAVGEGSAGQVLLLDAPLDLCGADVAATASQALPGQFEPLFVGFTGSAGAIQFEIADARIEVFELASPTPSSSSSSNSEQPYLVNLIQNPSFETWWPTSSRTYLAVNDTSLPSWTVSAGSAWVAPLGAACLMPPYHGSAALGLGNCPSSLCATASAAADSNWCTVQAGAAGGEVQQQVPTAPGANYTVYVHAWAEQAAWLKVSAGGSSQVFGIPAPGGGGGGALSGSQQVEVEYQQVAWAFTATERSTAVQLSAVAGPGGSVLESIPTVVVDAVAVVPWTSDGNAVASFSFSSFASTSTTITRVPQPSTSSSSTTSTTNPTATITTAAADAAADSAPPSSPPTRAESYSTGTGTASSTTNTTATVQSDGWGLPAGSPLLYLDGSAFVQADSAPNASAVLTLSLLQPLSSGLALFPLPVPLLSYPSSGESTPSSPNPFPQPAVVADASSTSTSTNSSSNNTAASGCSVRPFTTRAVLQRVNATGATTPVVSSTSASTASMAVVLVQDPTLGSSAADSFGFLRKCFQQSTNSGGSSSSSSNSSSSSSSTEVGSGTGAGAAGGCGGGLALSISADGSVALWPSPAAAVPLASAASPADIAGQAVVTMQLTFDSDSRNLSVWLIPGKAPAVANSSAAVAQGGSSRANNPPLLEVSDVNLCDFLGPLTSGQGAVYAGFTGTTGDCGGSSSACSSFQVVSWDLKVIGAENMVPTTPSDGFPAPGNDPNTSSPASSSSSNQNTSSGSSEGVSTVVVIVLGVTTGVLAALLVATVVFLVKARKLTSTSAAPSAKSLWGSLTAAVPIPAARAAAAAGAGGGAAEPATFRRMSEKEIMKATRSFNSTRQLAPAAGAYGIMYHGLPASGRQWAVKRYRMSHGLWPYCFRGFDDEVARLAAVSTRHKGIVPVLGMYTDEDEEFVAVYQYEQHPSLFECLHRRREPVLTLAQRLRIAVDVAETLGVLHDCSPPIVHRNLKPSNILVMPSMRARLTDFCFARSLGQAPKMPPPPSQQQAGGVGAAAAMLLSRALTPVKEESFEGSSRRNSMVLQGVDEGGEGSMEGRGRPGSAGEVAGSASGTSSEAAAAVSSPAGGSAAAATGAAAGDKAGAGGGGGGGGGGGRRPPFVPRKAQREGYVDPQVIHGINSSSNPHADVYSFGVILLELITGRLAVMPDPEDPSTNLIITDWGVHYVETGEVHLIGDPRIFTPALSEPMLRMGLVAADCVRTPATGRPDMSEVARRLHDILREHFGNATGGESDADSGSAESRDADTRVKISEQLSQ